MMTIIALTVHTITIAQEQMLMTNEDSVKCEEMAKGGQGMTNEEALDELNVIYERLSHPERL